MLSRAGARGGRIAVMVVAASLSCLAAAVLVGGRVGWHAVLLDPFDGAPRDPIVTPLLMGYDAEQRAARELARIAGPLQGAFSPTSQAQIYQSLRGLTTPGPGGGRLLVAPGGSEYELEALPLSRRQRLADEFVPVGDDKYDDELTRQALESYRQDQSAASDGALRAQALEGLGAGRQPFATSYGGRDVDDDDITRKALESYRQELAVPLPAEVEEPVALDAHALPVEGSAPAARAARKRVSRDKVRRLFERLQNPRDRAAAEVLVREDELARSLNAAVQKERPLQTLEGQMDKELRLTGIKMRDAQQVEQLGTQELARYHDSVAKEEKRGASNVHYLKAAHNYALEARKEVLDAQKRDQAGDQVLEGAPGVLKAAHRAQVKARVTDDAQGLMRAQDAINKELIQVEAARAGEAAAVKERADARENAFVSRVITRVREERFGGAHTSIKALALEGAKAHKDIAEATKELARNSAEHERAAVELKRAHFQDRVRGVTHAQDGADVAAIAALDATEAAGHRIDAAGRLWVRESKEAASEEQAAKGRELAAAALHA